MWKVVEEGVFYAEKKLSWHFRGLEPNYILVQSFKDGELWDAAVLSWHKKYVLLVATVAMIRLLKDRKHKKFLNIHV